MSEINVQEQIKAAQARVKALASKRDILIREVGVEEQKLQQVYENLKNLGINTPEKLSIEELETLEEEAQADLTSNLQSLIDSLNEGEILVAEYEKTQQSQ